MSEWLLYVKIGVLVILSDKITFFCYQDTSDTTKMGFKTTNEEDTFVADIYVIYAFRKSNAD